MANTKKLLLNIEGARLVGRVVFNGVVLAEDAITASLSRSFVLNGWTIQGANTLSAGLALMPPVSISGPQPGAASRFFLELKEIGPVSQPNQDTVLATFQWDASSMPLKVAQGREVFTQSFSWDPALTWAWTRATAVSVVSAEDRLAIEALLDQVRNALKTRDFASLQKLQSIQISEQALAIGEEPAAMFNSYMNFISERSAVKDWTVLSANLAALRIIPMAGGRIFLLRSDTGTPPVVCTGSAGGFAIEPFVSKINGQWAIVR